MKKQILLLAFALMTVLLSHATVIDTTAKPLVDTAATETTPLLSYQDVMNILGEQPMKCAEPAKAAFIAVIQQRANEYYQRKKAEYKAKNK